MAKEVIFRETVRTEVIADLDVTQTTMTTMIVARDEEEDPEQDPEAAQDTVQDVHAVTHVPDRAVARVRVAVVDVTAVVIDTIVDVHALDRVTIVVVHVAVQLVVVVDRLVDDATLINQDPDLDRIISVKQHRVVHHVNQSEEIHKKIM